MAAVLALVMLPAIAAIGFFLGTLHSGASLSSVFAAVAFVALALGVLAGALRFQRSLDGPED